MSTDIFFQELKKLLDLQPKRPSQILNSENCEHGNYVYYGKDLYNCFDCVQDSHGTYLFDTHSSANSADCDFCIESELCYESVDAVKCFNSNYLDYCMNTSDSEFSYDCTNCTNVFGCVRLKNKSFCIFNRQFTEEDYREKIKLFKSLPADKILEIVEKLKLQHPLTQTHEENNENSSYGNYIFNNKNCYLCFDASHNEGCGYLYDASYNKTSYDVTQSRNAELSLEVVDSGDIFNADYIVFSKNCRDSSYLFDCFDVKNSLGCVMLAHREYCILNRQLSQEEYERISAPLISELRSKYFGWENLAY